MFNLLAFLNLIKAGETKPPSILNLLDLNCQNELNSICPTLKNRNDIIDCLTKNKDKITNECQQNINHVREANRDIERRGGGLNSFGGFSMTPTTSPSIKYEGRFVPDHNSPNLNENKLNFSVPIFHEGNKSLSLSTEASDLKLNENLQLSSGIVIPNEYYRTEMGLNFLERLSEERSFGIRSSVGYNSDKLFMASRDLSFSLTAFYGFPSTDNSAWAATLYLANNGPFGNYIPIPGFIYFFHSPNFNGMFGFPFTTMQWTPNPDWTYSLSLFGINLTLEAAYGNPEQIQYFSGFSINKQSFMMHDRINDTDRLIFKEDKLYIGFRSPFIHQMSSEFQIGAAFERSAYIGSGFNTENGGSVNIGSSWYTSWTLKMYF